MSLPQRKPTRLKDFDYASINHYFVTICCKNRANYLGKVQDDVMIENKIGQLARQMWLELPLLFTGIGLDEYVIMPNHLHGIIVLNQRPQYVQAKKSATLSQIVGAFKSKTNVFTKRQLFPARKHVELWQKTFYDRVIRSENDLSKTREYICNNVKQWELDEYYSGGGV